MEKVKRVGTIRSAGVLCHISSFPSLFGIGDLGPEAVRFARFLKKSNQSWWQLLPLTPVEESQAFSPYSSVSTMAGNVLLISPELLAKEDLITGAELKRFAAKPGNKLNFPQAVKIKKKFLDIAYERFLTRNDLLEFKKFIRKEKYWLLDFSLYMALKDHFDGQAWYQWPDEFKQRNIQALEAFYRSAGKQIQRIQWEQYVFYQQWNRLREKCKELGIRLIGDLPFYVSFDSVDVWSNQSIFSVDQKGKMLEVAGVPPDYFNKNGQLWGMPVFKWEKLKERNYDWWINRLKKNLELYDLLRLDHFRAFADYWVVSAKAANAKKGEWKQGPGSDFFNVVKKHFGHMPFIAEDLGKISKAVYELRDEFGLPGMAVLQFAFGRETGISVHINHNHVVNSIVYTGTHDNNTTIGWFRNDLDDTGKKMIQDYIGKRIKASEVHEDLIRLAYSSVAEIVIIPMQDLLGLDQKARMNIPAAPQGNWQWIMNKEHIHNELALKIKRWTDIYGRNSIKIT